MGGGVVCMYVPFFYCTTPPTCDHHLQLRLCWAITMHKSQGQTLDKAVIDLGPKEACTGLTFVCLSRAHEFRQDRQPWKLVDDEG